MNNLHLRCTEKEFAGVRTGRARSAVPVTLVAALAQDKRPDDFLHDPANRAPGDLIANN
jgi:hypothetical protein